LIGTELFILNYQFILRRSYMVGSIKHLAEAIKLDLREALPYQRKTQKENLALLIATMLHVRSANTMGLEAELSLGD
jgi:hypothetical protein